MSDYRAIIEGICPTCGTNLERECEDHGWCPECRVGWSTEGDRSSVHIPVRSIEIDGHSIHAATVRIDHQGGDRT